MNLYAIRRERIIKDIVGDATLVLFSGTAINKSEDECYPFDVNRNFYYLTGLEKESMILVVNKVADVISESLFILPFDEKLAKWVGGRMLKEEASELSGINDVYDCAEFDGFIASTLNRVRKNPNHKLYLDLWHYSENQDLTPALKLAGKIRETHPAIQIVDAYVLLAKSRLVKDDYEITCLKRAIEITNSGVKQMMRSIKDGVNEMALEGIFNFVLSQNVCNKNSFKTICASGKRATILHYTDNNQQVKDGEMLLCDLGATYKNYCADISRTFPVNGKFTDRQRELYNIVLMAQRLVQSNAKPGVSLKFLNRIVVEYYKKELPKHGLNKDISEYYWHSVSHHIGLDTHDIDGGLGQVLEAGNVISNEPGLYVADENIGIRIEDDLLITGSGCENLSAAIPKAIEDIEITMKAK